MKGKITIRPSVGQLKKFASDVTEEIRKFIEKHQKPEGPRMVAFTETSLRRMDFVDGASPETFYGCAVFLSAHVRYTVKGGQLFEVVIYTEKLAYAGRQPTKEMLVILEDDEKLSPVELILFEPDADDIIVKGAETLCRSEMSCVNTSAPAPAAPPSEKI